MNTIIAGVSQFIVHQIYLGVLRLFITSRSIVYMVVRKMKRHSRIVDSLCEVVGGADTNSRAIIGGPKRKPRDLKTYLDEETGTLVRIDK